MEAEYVGVLGVLFLGGLSLFVVGFRVVVTRGCGGLLVGDGLKGYSLTADDFFL